MLVLSRKKDEKIIIRVPNQKDIILTVVRIENNRVRLGFEADLNVVILRSELDKPESSSSMPEHP